MEFKRLSLAAFSLVSVLSLTGCVESVTDYYMDPDYPPLPVVAVDRPLVHPVIVDRPVCHPVVVREHPVIVHERPAYRHHEVVVRRPHVIVDRPVVVRERPVVVHERPAYRHRYEESAFVRPHGRPGEATVVRHDVHHEDDSTAVVHPRQHRRNDRVETSERVNVAPPRRVSERPFED